MVALAEPRQNLPSALQLLHTLRFQFIRKLRACRRGGGGRQPSTTPSREGVGAAITNWAALQRCARTPNASGHLCVMNDTATTEHTLDVSGTGDRGITSTRTQTRV